MIKHKKRDQFDPYVLKDPGGKPIEGFLDHDFLRQTATKRSFYPKFKSLEPALAMTGLHTIATGLLEKSTKPSVNDSEFITIAYRSLVSYGDVGKKRGFFDKLRKTDLGKTETDKGSLDREAWALLYADDALGISYMLDYEHGLHKGCRNERLQYHYEVSGFLFGQASDTTGLAINTAQQLLRFKIGHPSRLIVSDAMMGTRAVKEGHAQSGYLSKTDYQFPKFSIMQNYPDARTMFLENVLAHEVDRLIEPDPNGITSATM